MSVTDRSTDVPIRPGAGNSALREYERRVALREDKARRRLGRLGVALTRATAEPSSTQAWKQGALGEVKTAARLAHHLRKSDARMLHDCRVPGHGRANIDHLVIGPAGVLVVDSKTNKGKVSVGRKGGLFSSYPVLLIGGRDRTRLIEGVERQVTWVSEALDRAGLGDIDVAGALCFPNVDGLPLFGTLKLYDVRVGGPRNVARWARRGKVLDATFIRRVWRELDAAFPPA